MEAFQLDGSQRAKGVEGSGDMKNGRQVWGSEVHHIIPAIPEDTG